MFRRKAVLGYSSTSIVSYQRRVALHTKMNVLIFTVMLRIVRPSPCDERGVLESSSCFIFYTELHRHSNLNHIISWGIFRIYTAHGELLLRHLSGLCRRSAHLLMLPPSFSITAFTAAIASYIGSVELPLSSPFFLPPSPPSNILCDRLYSNLSPPFFIHVSFLPL